MASITSALHLRYGLLQLGKEQTAFVDVIQLFLQFNFWIDPKTFTAANPKYSRSIVAHLGTTEKHYFK